jgi:hypothetical protein
VPAALLKPPPARLPALLGAGPLRRMEGVELFSVGWHRDREYTAAELRQTARTFAELLRGSGPRLDVPAVLGHEEEQAFLAALLAGDRDFQSYLSHKPPEDPFPHSTEVPAAGWLRNVRFVEATGKVVADIEGIPPSVAGLIDQGLLKFVSVELYEPFVWGGRDYGTALRRVALLGNEIPQVKSLKPLPKTTFAELRRPRRDRFGPYRCFAEAFMDRKALEDQLKALGWSDAAVGLLSSLDDATFAELVNTLLAEKAGAAPAAGGATAAADVPMPPRDQMIADLVQAGEDPAALELKTDDELYQLWMEKVGGAQMAEKPTPPAPPAPPPTTPPGVPGGTPAPTPAPQPTPQAVAQFAEWDRLWRQRVAGEVRDKIDRFCEEMVEKNILLPAHTEKTIDPATGKPRGFARRALEAADAVRKFADRPSDLETLMADMRKAPRVHDPAERVKASRPGAQDAAARKFAEAREAAAKAHAAAPAGKTLEERLRLLPRK